MKLPLDFGIKLFFRLLLPGFLLSLGVLPAYLALLQAAGLYAQREIAFVVMVILLGWLVLAADEPIYRLLEGRRYWPGWLWARMHASEERRLNALGGEIDTYFATAQPTPAQERRYLEASVERRAFPMRADGKLYAEYPTRLGNLIHSFEGYSDTRYGLDSIFYWPRIWVNLDKDTREELDGTQAMADSAVYCTFALGCTGALWLAYALLAGMNAAATGLLAWAGWHTPPLPAGVFRFLPDVATSLLLAATALLLSWLVYHFAFFTNQKFGTVFMALIDAHVGKVSTEYVHVDAITARVAREAGVPVRGGERLEVARRYLQYFQVKVPGRTRAVPFPEAAARANTKEGGGGNQADRT